MFLASAQPQLRSLAITLFSSHKVTKILLSYYNCKGFLFVQLIKFKDLCKKPVLFSKKTPQFAIG